MLLARWSSCAVVGLLLIAICYQCYHRLLASRLSSLLICVFLSSLHAVRSTLLTFCWWQHATRSSIFAVRCWLLAVCFSLFAFCFSLISSRFSLLARFLSLLSSRLVSSADRCTSSRIVHPCSRCVIRFSPHKYPPQWCSSLAAVPYYSHHRTLIAFHTMFFCCSQIPIQILLFSAHQSLGAAQFLFLASLCVPLSCCSPIVAFCFFFY